jgi:hypothetical protein
MKTKTILLLIFASAVLGADFQYSGKIYPLLRWQWHDQSELELPFRVASASLNLSRSNWEWKTTAAIESRWQDYQSTKATIRESYLQWYPRFGDLRIGRQILAWGYADQNNPTDNINPFDYYYLFETGIERKKPLWSMAATFNLENIILEGIINFEHQPHTFPLNEPDFPINISNAMPTALPIAVNPFEEAIAPEHPQEYGLRLRGTILNTDFSVSYFSGYDRIPQVLAINANQVNFPPVDICFGYRRTEVFGLDFFRFMGDLTLRGEGALYFSKNSQSGETAIDWDGRYLQYVLQGEYFAPADIQLTAQYMGKKILRSEGFALPENFNPADLMNPATLEAAVVNMRTARELGNDFLPGMGLPFLAFLDHAVSLGASRWWLYERLESTLMLLIDGDGEGMMSGLSINYLLNDYFQVKSAVSYFYGQNQDSFFKQMEDFSHLSLGLEFRF